MNLDLVLALLWLGFSMAGVVAFGYFLGWVDDHAERRKAHRAAE
jgi:hypothetical protein